MKKRHKGTSPQDCQEHMELSQRIDHLEREIRIMKCEKHHWIRNKGDWRTGLSGGFVGLICDKCGMTDSVTREYWHDIQLDQALDEVERLGGEVER